MAEMADSVGGVDSEHPTVEQVPIEEYEVVHTVLSFPSYAEQNTGKQQQKYNLLGLVGWSVPTCQKQSIWLHQ